MDRGQLQYALKRSMYSLRDRDGRHVRWAQRPEVFEWLRNGTVEPVWSGKRIRYIRLAGARIADFEGGNRPAGEKPYSHNHAVAEYHTDPNGRVHKRNALDANPRGVWTLRRIPADQAEIYREVYASVVRSQP